MAFEAGLLEELDGLWQAATFLQCGDAEEAETLLVRAMASAARGHAAKEPGRPSAPLEPHLIRMFLDGVRSRSEETVVRPGVSPGQAPGPPDRQIPPNGSATNADREIPVAALHAAAASMPPSARAAIWLVLIRRWSYDDATALLGVDPGDLRELLRFQDVFAATALEEPTAAPVRRRVTD